MGDDNVDITGWGRYDDGRLSGGVGGFVAGSTISEEQPRAWDPREDDSPTGGGGATPKMDGGERPPCAPEAPSSKTHAVDSGSAQ
eukprot:5007767-Prymnesium_polylepis.1